MEVEEEEEVGQKQCQPSADLAAPEQRIQASRYELNRKPLRWE